MRKAAYRLLAGIVCLGLPIAANAGVPYTNGDVFVAVGDGQVVEFTPAGVKVQTLNDGTHSTYTAGMAFDSTGNLYVTNFGPANGGTVSKFDNSGNLILGSFITGQTNPESISMPGGHFPAVVGDAGLKFINTYDNGGVLVHSYGPVPTEVRGTDWVELLSDGKTVLYTSEGTSILSYDISGSGSKNPPVVTNLPTIYKATAFQFRLVLSGPYAGDYLVADNTAVLLVTPGDASLPGHIVQTYLASKYGRRFAVSLSPDGTAFWTADVDSGYVWEIDIATGKELHSWFDQNALTTVGLAIYGEQGQDGTGYLEICKTSCPLKPVTGNFTFTATNGNFNSGPLSVPVNACTGTMQVPTGVVTINETARLGTHVTAISAYGYNKDGFKENRLLSDDLPFRTSNVTVVPDDPSLETVVTYTNCSAAPGALKICKVAGAGVKLNDYFRFQLSIAGDPFHYFYNVPAGPPPYGYCVQAGSYAVGTQIDIQELVDPSKYQVDIAVSPPDRGGTKNPTGINVAIDSGITEVTFTNTSLVVQGSCQPSESLSVRVNPGNVSGNNVLAFVPLSHWQYFVDNGQGPPAGNPGVAVVSLEGTYLPTQPTVPTGNDLINSCAATPLTNPPQAVCTSNSGNVWVFEDPAGTGDWTKSTVDPSGGSGLIEFSGGCCTACGVAMDAAHSQAVITLGIGGMSTDTCTLHTPYNLTGQPGFRFLTLNNGFGISPKFWPTITSPAKQVSEDIGNRSD